MREQLYPEKTKVRFRLGPGIDRDPSYHVGYYIGPGFRHRHRINVKPTKTGGHWWVPEEDILGPENK